MEKLTPWKIGTLGLQHVLAMYAGAVIVPLIVGPAVGMTPEQLSFLISIDLFTCGIASLLQVVGGKYFGIKLPVILGCTFTAVGPMIAIGKLQGITAIYGAIIVSGIVVMILAQIMSRVMRYFPPVVTGSVVTIIGISLIPVAMNNVAGGVGAPDFGNLRNLLLAALTLALIIFINRYLSGYMRAVSVLISMILGTLVAMGMGMVNLSSVSQASWFHMVQPFYFGIPTFHITAILTMILVAIVSMIESTGVFLALGDVCEKKLESSDIKKGLRAEGLASFIGGIFNAFPYTTFSQNVGLVALTRIKTRNVVIAAGVILMILGLVPKVSALTMIIPNPVLGGAMIAMFGMVISSGAKMLSRVDFHKNENLLIIAVSVGIGLGASVVPDAFAKMPEGLRLLFQNGIVIGSFTAIVLNLFLNKREEQKNNDILQDLKSDHSAESSI
ncbi:nucleobase:cation symporter-2 family protein [Neobacillus rhizophilus]|uniref:Purine permease n=1 Tax=Neobacillus rhizophilus TaxID=2833579 RepID=A0A942TZH1_9BACI|nr:nucleobase:cation symporter-2 family protein [Neobacillus rhizophilus]MBS4211686.1 purine permease [Neobacillus rhizophilus]